MPRAQRPGRPGRGAHRGRLPLGRAALRPRGRQPRLPRHRGRLRAGPLARPRTHARRLLVLRVTRIAGGKRSGGRSPTQSAGNSAPGAIGRRTAAGLRATTPRRAQGRVASRRLATSSAERRRARPSGEVAELERAEADAAQREHPVADRLDHAADLAVAAFAQDDLDLALADPAHLGRGGRPVLQRRPRAAGGRGRARRAAAPAAPGRPWRRRSAGGSAGSPARRRWSAAAGRSSRRRGGRPGRGGRGESTSSTTAGRSPGSRAVETTPAGLFTAQTSRASAPTGLPFTRTSFASSTSRAGSGNHLPPTVILPLAMIPRLSAAKRLPHARGTSRASRLPHGSARCSPALSRRSRSSRSSSGLGSKRDGSGSWSSPESPKRRSNSSEVLKIAAPNWERPDSSIRPRSARLCHRRLRGDAADAGDLGAGDRLQVGDDRQRLGLGLGQRRRPRLRQQPPRRLLAGRVAGEGEAAGDLAQDDAPPALGQVLAQQLDRLADLSLGRLGRLGQVGDGDRLGREEEQRLDGAGEVAHAGATLRTAIGPSGLLCSQVISPLRYSSSRPKIVTAWVSRSSPPNSSSKSKPGRRRRTSRRARRRRSSETVGRMWLMSTPGGSVSRSPSAAPSWSGS